jgi:threonine synthase
MMKYCSTRGHVTGLQFEDVIFSGFLADGGMALPESIPQISKETLISWAGLSYRDLVLKIVPLFVSEGEVPFSDLQSKIIVIDICYISHDYVHGR